MDEYKEPSYKNMTVTQVIDRLSDIADSAQYCEIEGILCRAIAMLKDYRSIAGIMAFSHDITFCAGELVDCPKKESCYRYKEVDRFQPGEVFSMATLYKAACCEANDFQLFIGDDNEMCEERTI